jgi:hypothetical protein
MNLEYLGNELMCIEGVSAETLQFLVSAIFFTPWNKIFKVPVEFLHFLRWTNVSIKRLNIKNAG